MCTADTESQPLGGRGEKIFPPNRPKNQQKESKRANAPHKPKAAKQGRFNAPESTPHTNRPRESNGRMIIDKLQAYWTDEDRQRTEELNQKIDKLLYTMKQNRERGESAPDIDSLHTLSSLEDEVTKIRDTVKGRYLNSGNRKLFLADAEEIISAIEKEDFLAILARRKETITPAIIAQDETLKELIAENFANCYNCILNLLALQIASLSDDDKSLSRILSLAEKRVALWYVKPQSAYMLMAHGRATDTLAFMNTKNARIDRITGTATIEKQGVRAVIENFEALRATLNMSTDKLLSTAISAFTENNDFSHSAGKEPKREVTISLADYARDLKYDIDEHETSTPEEARREKRRAKTQLDNARKAIKKDLLLLHALKLHWEERIKGKNADFESVSLFTRVAIRNGEIKLYLTPELASYLVERNLLSWYPRKLLGLDNRQQTAYNIGVKLFRYYHIDNNQIRGTNDRISIPSLLAVTDLPTYEEVQKKDRGHWISRIKEPFERALDTLTQEEILKDWRYTHAKGIDLTEEEAYSITRYEDFANLYLRFTPEDKVDDTERITAKLEARKEARQRTRGTRKKD